MEKKPVALTFAGLSENVYGKIMAMMVGEGVEWLYDIPMLETRAVNRARQKLSTEEEEKALAALIQHPEG